MSWIIRILLFLVLVSVIRSLLTRVFSPTLKTHYRPHVGSDRGRKTVSGQMIKDPQCGMYVAADLAITKRLKGKTLHFCSEECGENFINQRKRSDQPDRQAV